MRARTTVTADALHTQRTHARFLVEEKTHYLLVVKANQPELHRRLRPLPWKDTTARRYDRETGHGRKETRVTRALTITGLRLDFLQRLSRLTRSQWTIENRLHFVTLRATGHRNIAARLRHASYEPSTPPARPAGPSLTNTPTRSPDMIRSPIERPFQASTEAHSVASAPETRESPLTSRQGAFSE
ncbi:hypothetical protein [Kitasatospora phosalacinea]|uniref:Transposase IS4-like domain-containing protein n=1 Tax=Kitasatospora phosalacinea TaxID=2065 RepID=A0A9W6UTD1_9ACTN|nr:hypothetical protein [Kitasatospora phosalacinea]GLW59518.1 hypothetical protein Kpho01_75280 [Kitasatospora phosalacinea]